MEEYVLTPTPHYNYSCTCCLL